MIKEAAWLFQSHVEVAVGADMMQKPEISDDDSASVRTYLDASRMYDWNDLQSNIKELNFSFTYAIS